MVKCRQQSRQIVFVLDQRNDSSSSRIYLIAAYAEQKSKIEEQGQFGGLIMFG